VEHMLVVEFCDSLQDNMEQALRRALVLESVDNTPHGNLGKSHRIKILLN